MQYVRIRNGRVLVKCGVGMAVGDHETKLPVPSEPEARNATQFQVGQQSDTTEIYTVCFHIRRLGK